MSTAATPSLRSQIIGAWELAEYSAWLPDDELNLIYPMGSDARGFIIYTPDGYMSAQLTASFTQNLSDKGDSDVADTDFLQSWGNYIAYTGPFYLDEEGDKQGRPILMHKMAITNCSYLVGGTQRRICQITDEKEGRFLDLSLDEPMVFSGVKRLIRVRWRRVPSNTASSPPEQ